MDDQELSPERLGRVDRRKIFNIYENWPSYALQAYGLAPVIGEREYRRIIYVAMGGSAAAGDMISDWFLATNGPEVSVFNGYLPKVDLDDALVIACSTSGSTAETLGIVRSLAKRKERIVTISAGGKLKELAARAGIPHVEIPLLLAPRYTLPYSLFASIAVLKSASLLGPREREVKEAISNLSAVAKEISSDVPVSRNPSKQAAAVAVRGNMRIYASSVAKGVAKRFKNELNENAKLHAFYDSGPDLFHNEVESWERPEKQFSPVFIRHSREPPFERKNMERFIRILEREGVKTRQYKGLGNGSLSQLVTVEYMLDFATYYAAILREVDPFRIRIIDELKSR